MKKPAKGKGRGTAPVPEKLWPDEPVDHILNVTDKCNQRCLFCSRGRIMDTHDERYIRAVIAKFKDAVCFEGGEPTLFPDILKWIRHARDNGVRDILLVTNGFGLDDPAVAEKFSRAGVTLFNVNLPAHEAGAFDALTQTRGNFPKRRMAVRTLINTAGGRRVRVTLVVNSLIMAKIPEYAAFILREYPELRYLEINFPKFMGVCTGRPWLVPRLNAVKPFLLKALRALEAGGMQVIMDGFPLCMIKGYEHCAIDAQFLANGGEQSFMAEKEQCPPCVKCSLKGLCKGPRKDYVALYDWKELRPSSVDPATIIRKIGRMFAPGEIPTAQGLGENIIRSAPKRRKA